MSSAVSLRDELRQLIDELTDEQVELLIDQVNNLLDPDQLTPEEEERAASILAEMRAGNRISHQELMAELGLTDAS